MAKRICLQAGHKSMTSGATGAAGERDWNSKIVPMIATILRSKGCEVYETDAKGNNDSKVTSTDWDYFLAVHYDADIYNDRGGFVDYPDKSVDMVHERSKALALALSEHYFKATGIPERPQRSNANTKFYYMWSALTANTPCVIIECGVGNRKPDDYNILRNYDLISEAIATGILEGLGLENNTECEEKLEQVTNELIDMRASRDKWKREVRELQEKYGEEVRSKDKMIETLQKTNSELTAQITVMSKQVKSAIDEKNQAQGILEPLRVEISASSAKVLELSDEIKKLKEKLAKNLKGYNKSELLRAYFGIYS